MKYDPLNKIICPQGGFLYFVRWYLTVAVYVFQAVIHCLIEYRAIILYKRGICNRSTDFFLFKSTENIKKYLKM